MIYTLGEYNLSNPDSFVYTSEIESNIFNGSTQKPTSYDGTPGANSFSGDVIGGHGNSAKYNLIQ